MSPDYLAPARRYTPLTRSRPTAASDPYSSVLLQCPTARICFSPAAATYLITDARPPFFARNIRSATHYVIIAAPHRTILAACAIYHHRAHCHITLSSTPALTPSRSHYPG